MKKILSDAENKLIVFVPPVRRLSNVAVKFELAAIVVQVEHVRIAIAIGYVCKTIFLTAQAIMKRLRAVFYLGSKIRQFRIPSKFLLLDKIKITLQEVITAHALNLDLSVYFQEDLTA